MRFVIIVLLLATSACGRDNKNKIYLAMANETLEMTSRGLVSLQIQSKNMEIQVGTEEDHRIKVEYASDKSISIYGKNVLGLAYLSAKGCEIWLAEKTFKMGQDWVTSVLWHEIGHCFYMDHLDDSSDIMYKYASPITAYSEESKQRFFQRLYEETH